MVGRSMPSSCEYESLQWCLNNSWMRWRGTSSGWNSRWRNCPIWYLFIISCTDTLVWIRSERSEREAGRFYFKLSANRCGPAATIYEAVPRADSIWGVGTLNYEGYELIELLLQVFPSACGALHQSNVNDRHDSLWAICKTIPVQASSSISRDILWHVVMHSIALDLQSVLLFATTIHQKSPNVEINW